jgi:hypothetical protein
MYKLELVYNHVYPLDEDALPNTVLRAVNNEHVEELLSIGNGFSSVVAPASPLACPIGQLSSDTDVEPNFVEKMGYYVSLWGGDNANS